MHDVLDLQPHPDDDTAHAVDQALVALARARGLDPHSHAIVLHLLVSIHQQLGITVQPLAVWSGDTVRYDDEGYLYFIGRRDEMIKTSGYRVSPTEVEEAVYRLDPALIDVAAIGVPHPELEQAILILYACRDDYQPDETAWLNQLKRNLPNFMVPKALLRQGTMPKNANGKIDRKSLAALYQSYFAREDVSAGTTGFVQ